MVRRVWEGQLSARKLFQKAQCLFAQPTNGAMAAFVAGSGARSARPVTVTVAFPADALAVASLSGADVSGACRRGGRFRLGSEVRRLRELVCSHHIVQPQGNLDDIARLKL